MDLDTLDGPQGDVTTRLCRTGDRGWRVVNRSQATPGEVTGDVVAWKENSRSWMQKQVDRRCPVPYYVHHSFCGRTDTFLNYDAGKVIKNTIITSKSNGALAKGRAEPGEEATKTELTFSLSGEPYAEEYYPLVGTTTDCTTEDEPLRDIVTCTVPQCLGPCGELIDACAELHVTATASGGGVADGYVSADNAATWTVWGGQPFIADEDIVPIVCVQIDRTTERLIVGRGTTDAANFAEVAYSDDNGANWTPVNVGTTSGEYFLHSGSLFAYDQHHIWGVTDLANVFFSADGGLTWTDQNAPAPAASEGLWGVHFVDENHGWAVGGFRTTPTGHFIQTVDGGAHWNMAAAEPKVELGIWVSVIDAYRVWVGLDDGTVYYTNDWGATWNQRALPVTPVNTGDGRFLDEYCGWICGYYNDGSHDYPIVYRTINGGADWDHYIHATYFSTTVENFGLNALQACGYNEVHVVGEQLTGGNSVIWTLKPAGW